VSIYSELCDTILAEVIALVPALSGIQVHRYTPRSIENLVADGEPHIACWAAGEGGEETVPHTTGNCLVRYSLGLAYWEPDEEGDDHQASEDAAYALYEMLEDVRAIFMSDAFRTQQGGRMDWVGAEVGIGGAQTGGLVRWWVAELVVWVPVPYTA